jgi:hypothetical protein
MVEFFFFEFVVAAYTSAVKIAPPGALSISYHQRLANVLSSQAKEAMGKAEAHTDQK